jgi:hypothetical protein
MAQVPLAQTGMMVTVVEQSSSVKSEFLSTAGTVLLRVLP